MSTYSTESAESRDRLKENEKAIKHDIGSRKCSKCNTQMLLGYLRPMNATRLDDHETEVLWDGGNGEGVLLAVDAWACPKCGNVEFKVIFPKDIKSADNPIKVRQNEKPVNKDNSLTQPMIYESYGSNVSAKYCPDCLQPLEVGMSKCPVCGKKVNQK
jgi:uncharacterized protein (UPF0212 family)